MTEATQIGFKERSGRPDAAQASWGPRRRRADRRQREGPQPERRAHCVGPEIVHPVPGIRRRGERRQAGAGTGNRPHPRCALRRRQRSAGCGSHHLQRDAGLFPGRHAPVPESRAICRADAQAGIHHAGAHLFHRLRTGPGGDPHRPAPAASPGPEPALGHLVPAAPVRFLRAAFAAGAEPHPHGARRHRPRLWPRRVWATTSAWPATGWTRTTTTSLRACWGQIYTRSPASCSECARRSRPRSTWSGWARSSLAVWSGRQRSRAPMMRTRPTTPPAEAHRRRNRRRASCAPAAGCRWTALRSGSCARPAATWRNTGRCGRAIPCWR